MGEGKRKPLDPRGGGRYFEGGEVQPHHEDGHCLHCGGAVGKDGYSMALGGEIEGEEEGGPERGESQAREETPSSLDPTGGVEAEQVTGVEGMITDQRDATDDLRAAAFVDAIGGREFPAWPNAPADEDDERRRRMARGGRVA